MERNYRLIIVILAIFSLVIPLLENSRSNSFKPDTPAFYSTLSNSPLVSIGGDVTYPGIYPLTAITLTDGVINMARPIRNIRSFLPHGSEKLLADPGCHYEISINTEGYAEIVKNDISVPRRMLLGIPLNINRMTASDFEQLPGIGPVMGKKIVEYRHKNGGNMDVPDLKMIEGIGEKRYAQLEVFFKPLKGKGNTP